MWLRGTASTQVGMGRRIDPSWRSVICDVLVEFQYCVVRERDVAPWYSVYPGWDGSSDRSLMAECNL